MSLKNTAIAESNIDTPITKRKTYIIGIGAKTIVQCNGDFVIMKTIKNARRENPKLTSEEKTFVNGKIYFGTYTLFIIALFVAIEVVAIVVASLKKLYIINPDSKYTGKFGISKRKK